MLELDVFDATRSVKGVDSSSSAASGGAAFATCRGIVEVGAYAPLVA